MLLRLLSLIAAVAPYTLADIQFTSPSAGSTVTGGQTLKVSWKDSGDKPPMSDLSSYQLFLCAGGNDADSFIQLAPVQSKGTFPSTSTTGTISVNLGGSAKNAYFLKMISAAPGGTVTNYSNRFSLSGMTGTFPPNVQAGIKDIDGTDGPETENNVNDNAAVPAAGADGPFKVPFTLQTGLTMYAPMQSKAGTKITKKNPTPLYPTSSARKATTYLPTPKQVTTITASRTWTAAALENTAKPAQAPMDDMQKYLARWRD
ncbi:hypothetical protein MMC21_005129 [Puttea exsequens]|nr:hypothetical protein [Puttea exsequens]